MTELMPSLCNDCILRNQCGKDDVKMCASYIKEIKIKCDDCKFVDNCVDYGWQGCRKFTPKPTEPMTNEEYIRNCSTEELPKALKEMFFDIKSRVRSELGGYNELMKSERYFDEWLKEKHGKDDDE